MAWGVSELVEAIADKPNEVAPAIIASVRQLSDAELATLLSRLVDTARDEGWEWGYNDAIDEHGIEE